MDLIQSIQSDLIEQTNPVGPILLKMRLLAARLGSDVMEQWVHHESTGYPQDTDVPDYRKLPVRYTGTYSAPGYIGRNEIPLYVVQKFAGEHWTRYEFRQSIVEVDDLIRAHRERNAGIEVEASNLALLLGRKLYEGMECIGATGTISPTSVISLQHAVRDRALALMVELERLPDAENILSGGVESGNKNSSDDRGSINQTISTVITGHNVRVSGIGPSQKVTFDLNRLDEGRLLKAIVDAGVPEKNAREFVDIVSEEGLENAKIPFKKRTQEWIENNISPVATQVFTKSLTDILTHLLRNP